MGSFLGKSKRFVEDTVGLSIGLAKSRKEIINEAIDLERKFIFIGVTKTGTSSIRTQLKQEGEPWVKPSHLNIIQIRDLIYPFLLKSSLAKNNQYPNPKHLSDAELRLKSAQIFEECFKFSSVRNPWARAVSLYFRSEGMQMKHKMDFEEFCNYHQYASDTCQNPTLHHNQSDWHVDEKGNNLMDYVFRIEDLNEAVEEINTLTDGKLVLEPVNINKNKASKSRNYQQMYNEKTKSLIAKRFEKDIDLFKYTF